MTKLFFVSRNKHKLKEAESIIGPLGVLLVPVEQTIEELQTTDVQLLVRDKALRAFKALGQPLFVEHTGLYFEHLNGLPGGLTQIFWDKLEADRFCELFGDKKLSAKTVIGYIDGRSVAFSKAKSQGQLPLNRAASAIFSGTAYSFRTATPKHSLNWVIARTRSRCEEEHWMNLQNF